MDGIKEEQLSRQEHTQRIGRISALLDKGIEFYREEGNESNIETLSKLKADVENGEFSIVVVGEFSAGKSTLLNALMGKYVLPSWTSETTATVNFMRHIDKSENGEGGKIYYKDGTIEDLWDVSVASLKKHVSTYGDDVVGKIKFVDLYFESDFLKNGVTLVDSPGLNGIEEGHKEITEDQILKSHASIFLFSSDHPGTKTDFEFLHDLQKKVKTIFFVLNKIDVVKEEENETVESVIETLKKNYKKQFPDEKFLPEIWPVSAIEALKARDPEALKIESDERGLKKHLDDSRLVLFENRLMKFLTCGEKSKAQMLAPIDKIIAIAKDSKDEYKSEINMLENVSDTAEIEKEIAELEVGINDIKKDNMDRAKAIRDNVDSKINELINDIKDELGRYEKSKLAEIDSIEDFEMVQEYCQDIKGGLERKIKRISSEWDNSLRDKIKEVIYCNYYDEAASLEQKLSANNSMIEIKLKDNFEIDDRFFEIGLSAYDERLREKELTLGQMRQEETSAEDDYIKAKSEERERERLRQEIKDLNEQILLIKSQKLPDAVDIKKIEYKKKTFEDDGVFGVIGQFFKGSRKEVSEGKDYSDRNRAIQRQADDINKKEIVKVKLEERLNNLNNRDVDAIHGKYIRKSNEITNLINEIATIKNENKEEIKGKIRVKINSLKRRLKSYIEFSIETVEKNVRGELQGHKKIYADMIAETISANLLDEITRKQDKLAKMKEHLAESESNKNERINMLKNQEEKIMCILDEATEIYAELNSIEADHIEDVAL